MQFRVDTIADRTYMATAHALHVQVQHAESTLTQAKYREKIATAKLSCAKLLAKIAPGGHTLISWAAAHGQVTRCSVNSLPSFCSHMDVGVAKRPDFQFLLEVKGNPVPSHMSVYSTHT